MNLRVSYDAQAFRMQREGGISRYFAELVRAYNSESDLGIDAVLRTRLVASRHVHDVGPRRRWLIPPRALRYAAPLLPTGPGQHKGADLVHHTYYLPSELKDTWRTPRVSTIHDMIPELMPELFPYGNPHQAKREYVRVSRGLIFVSETSRRDLFRIYGPQDVPTAVVPLAPSEEFRPSPDRADGSHPYVVFVGARVGYKEFDTLLLALSKARAHSLSLWAVGGGAFSARELGRIADLGLGHRVMHTKADDSELAKIYSSALALVAPSRCEGFGLPLVEAMASGCPVVASEIAVFREVAADAAQYFPVGNAEALADVLDRVHRDVALRRNSRREGLLRVKNFTWRNAARQTADLYRQVVLN